MDEKRLVGIVNQSRILALHWHYNKEMKRVRILRFLLVFTGYMGDHVVPAIYLCKVDQNCVKLVTHDLLAPHPRQKGTQTASRRTVVD